MLIKLIKAEGVTVTHGVPTILQMLLAGAASANVDLKGLNMVIGGSALPKAQITDRIKDVIKTGGEWFSSLELEDIITQRAGIIDAR